MRRARLEPWTYRSGVWGVNHTCLHNAIPTCLFKPHKCLATIYSQSNSKKIVRVCTSVPSSPCLRPWVLVWPRAQTHDIPSTLQSNTLLTSALSNPYLWGNHLNLICVSRTLKWSSLNKILILNYLLTFLWNAYSTNPSKQYLYLKMTPKVSVSVTRNNYLQAGSLVFPTDVFDH